MNCVRRFLSYRGIDSGLPQMGSLEGMFTHRQTTRREVAHDADVCRWLVEPRIGAVAGGTGAIPMPTSLESVIQSYTRAKTLARGTRDEYLSTINKWKAWDGKVSLEELGRRETREFLDWVYERAVQDEGTNPGRTANKAGEHLRAVMSWAWEQDLIPTLPRFPKARPQRAVAGRHYLTKAELNALYFATHRMRCPRGWRRPHPVGRYWRCALVLFVNYGLDTGTIWKSTPFHEPILWRHITWDRQSPDGRAKERSRWGWIFYRRVKSGKSFYRPMNRVVHAHIKSIMPADPEPNEPVLYGGGTRPNRRFQPALPTGRNPAEDRSRNRRGEAMAAEGSPKDVRDLLRRARS